MHGTERIDGKRLLHLKHLIFIPHLQLIETGNGKLIEGSRCRFMSNYAARYERFVIKSSSDMKYFEGLRGAIEAAGSRVVYTKIRGTVSYDEIICYKNGGDTYEEFFNRLELDESEMEFVNKNLVSFFVRM